MLTPKAITAWVIALSPIAGGLVWIIDKGIDITASQTAIEQRFVTWEQAQAAHIDTNIKLLEMELRSLDTRELNPQQMAYYKQLLTAKNDLEKERAQILGIVIGIAPPQ